MNIVHEMIINNKEVDPDHVKILHHTDPDGWCAGYWAGKRFNVTKPSNFIPMIYGDTKWINNIKNNDKVIIVDFSIEPEEMTKLLKITDDVIWIDHHISAIDKYKDYEVNIPGLRYDGIAASVLTYCYFNEMKDGEVPFDPEIMTVKAPKFTQLIGDHDVWKYEFGDETRFWKLGFDAYGTVPPYSPIWETLYDLDTIHKIVSNGEVIQKYRDAMGKKACEEYGFEHRFGEYKAFCLNNCFGGSEWFTDLIKDYDLVCEFLYCPNGKYWEYSFYIDKDNVDVSEIASNWKDKISGGGHKKAAGLETKEFIF